MTGVITFIIAWIVVPLVMTGLLIFAIAIAASARSEDLRASAWAGLLGGLLVFVIYVVSQLGVIHEPSFVLANLPGLLKWPLVLGFLVGFMFLLAVRLLVPTRLIGLITLALSASTTSAFFTYVFFESLRVSTLYLTLGFGLGVLAHIVLFPRAVRGVFTIDSKS